MKICAMDDTFDHYGNSVWFEQFWAAMVSMAFEESDVKTLINKSLKYFPKTGKARHLVNDVTAL